MTVAEESPQWVDGRTSGIIGMLQRQYGLREDIRLAHVKEPGLRKHEFWFCTPSYEEDGAELGYYRLTVQHPENCACVWPT